VSPTLPGRGGITVRFYRTDHVLVLGVVSSGRVYLLSPLALVSPAVAQTTLIHLNTAFSSSSASTAQNEPKKVPDAKWVRPTEDERDRGILIIVEIAGTPKQITWHRKGDYFSTVAVDGTFTEFC
jgi:ribosome biogenesis protein ERB1